MTLVRRSEGGAGVTEHIGNVSFRRWNTWGRWPLLVRREVTAFE